MKYPFEQQIPWLRLSKATQNTVPLQQKLVACALIMRQAKKEVTLGKLHEGCKAWAKGPCLMEAKDHQWRKWIEHWKADYTQTLISVRNICFYVASSLSYNFTNIVLFCTPPFVPHQYYDILASIIPARKQYSCWCSHAMTGLHDETRPCRGGGRKSGGFKLIQNVNLHCVLCYTPLR